jgi:protein-S-isoprenylcysteine O-methyltransferase Ste14
MENDVQNPHKNRVHKILAQSYSVYFFAILFGSVFSLIFGIQVFSSLIWREIGTFLLLFGSILIIWAQYTSAHLDKKNITKETFYQGPYRFSRTPTNFGLFFMVLGFSLIINTFFIILFTLIAFVVAKFVFLNKEEKILEEKYGAPYLEYKKLVKF